MKYSLIDHLSDLPGICNADSAWIHLGCGGALTPDDAQQVQEAPLRLSSPHTCSTCGEIGYLGLPTAPAVDGTTTAVEWMLPRWTADADLRRSQPVPSDPAQWLGFLRTYFPDGVWVIPVQNRPEYPEIPGQPARLRTELSVERDDEHTIDLALSLPNDGPTIFLRNTSTIQELSPGVLILTSELGDAIRLDGHLTSIDKATVLQVRTGYGNQSASSYTYYLARAGSDDPHALFRISGNGDPQLWVPFTAEWVPDLRLVDALHAVDGNKAQRIDGARVDDWKATVGATTEGEHAALMAALNSSGPHLHLDDYERGIGTTWNPRARPLPPESPGSS